MSVVVVVVVVISASCVGYGVRLFFGKLFSLNNNFLALQLHADLSVYFRNGHNRWILYPEGSVYSSGLSLRECSFLLGSKKVRFYGGRLRSEFKEIEQWLN